MSPQLSLSSLFSVIALGSLCAVAALSDIAGIDLAAPETFASTQATTQQAEISPSLPL